LSSCGPKYCKEYAESIVRMTENLKRVWNYPDDQQQYGAEFHGAPEHGDQVAEILEAFKL